MLYLLFILACKGILSLAGTRGHFLTTVTSRRYLSRLSCGQYDHIDSVLVENSMRVLGNSLYSREEMVLCLRERSGQSDGWNTLNKQERLAIEQSLIGHMKDIVHRASDRVSKVDRKEDAKYFSEMVYLLGKLGARPQHLESNFLPYLWELYEKASPGEYVGKTMYGLASMGIRWKDMPPKTAKALVVAFSRQLDGMGELSLVNLVYSLGKMEMGWHHIPAHTRKSICSSLVRVSPSMDSRAVANAMWGLGRSKVRWANLPEGVQECLCERLELTSPWGPQALSSFLNGLRRSGARWRGLPQRLRAAILSTLPSSLRSNASEHATATIMSSLGGMGMHYRELNDESRLAVGEALVCAAPLFTRQGLSSSMNGLAKMSWPLHRHSPAAREALMGALERVLQQVGEETSSANVRLVCGLTWSLGQLEALWGEGATDNDGGEIYLLYSERVVLGEHARSLLARALTQHLRYANEQGVFSAVSGLARMKATWLGLQSRSGRREGLHTSLSQSLIRTAPSMRVQAVCSTLWALGSLGLDWAALGEIGVREPLVEATIRVSTKLNMQGVSITVYSLAALNCHYEALPFPLRLSLQGAFLRNNERAKPREVAIILYSWGRMEAHAKNSFNNKTRAAMLASLERVVGGMDEQNLGNAVWGLCGRMQLRYSQFPPSCRAEVGRAIVAKQDSLNMQSLMSVLHGLSRAAGENWSNFDTEMKGALIAAVARISSQLPSRSSQSSSKLAGNVLYALGRLDVPLGQTGLTPEVQDCLVSHLAGNGGTPSVERSRAVSFGLNGLAHMCKWPLLSSEQREGLLAALRLGVPSFLPVDLANTMWSLGRMGVPFTDIPQDIQATLLAALGGAVGDMSCFELVWTLWALDRMQVRFQGEERGIYASLDKTLLPVLTAAIPLMSMQELGLMMFAVANLQLSLSEPALVDEIFKKLNQ